MQATERAVYLVTSPGFQLVSGLPFDTVDSQRTGPTMRGASGPKPGDLAKPAGNADHLVDRLFVGHAAEVLAGFPSACIDLVVTSPPYWTAVEYDRNQNPWPSYEAYLADMQSVWRQCARVLR